MKSRIVILLAGALVGLTWFFGRSRIPEIDPILAENLIIGLALLIIFCAAIFRPARGVPEEEAQALQNRLTGQEKENGILQKTLDEARTEVQRRQEEGETLRSGQEELRQALAASQARCRELEAAEESADHAAGVLTFLSALQEKGRLVDFLMQDISAIPDPRVGAVARMVHQGCGSILKDYFTISPVLDDREGSRVTVPDPVDSRRYRLVGRVGDDGPFSGTLTHKGWRTTRINLPEQADGEGLADLIAPAEIEIHQE